MTERVSTSALEALGVSHVYHGDSVYRTVLGASLSGEGFGAAEATNVVPASLFYRYIASKPTREGPPASSTPCQGTDPYQDGPRALSLSP